MRYQLAAAADQH